MFRSFGRRPLTGRGIVIGVVVIFAISGFPNIAIACEGASGEERRLGETEGGIVAYTVHAPASLCNGNVSIENISTVPATIEVTKEEGIECKIKTKGCEGKKLVNKPAKCESAVEKPGTTPRYEVKVKWNGIEFGPDIWKL